MISQFLTGKIFWPHNMKNIFLTYRCIPSLAQNSLPGGSSQRLGAGHNAICAVNDAPATLEIDKARLRGRIYIFSINIYHCESKSKTAMADREMRGDCLCYVHPMDVEAEVGRCGVPHLAPSTLDRSL